jgi:predicted DNA-binding protein (UPF0251 family)
VFKPAGVPAHELERLLLAVDELEAIRLVDLEGLSHEQAAAVMNVSRQTVGRVLERGRAKVAEALVAGKAIVIGGGQYRVEPRTLCCLACGAVWKAEQPAPPADCPSCGAVEVTTCWDPVGGCGRGRGRGRGCHGGREPGPEAPSGPGHGRCGDGRGRGSGQGGDGCP